MNTAAPIRNERKWGRGEYHCPVQNGRAACRIHAASVRNEKKWGQQALPPFGMKRNRGSTCCPHVRNKRRRGQRVLCPVRNEKKRGQRVLVRKEKKNGQERAQTCSPCPCPFPCPFLCLLAPIPIPRAPPHSRPLISAPKSLKEGFGGRQDLPASLVVVRWCVGVVVVRDVAYALVWGDEMASGGRQRL